VLLGCKAEESLYLPERLGVSYTKISFNVAGLYLFTERNDTRDWTFALRRHCGAPLQRVLHAATRLVLELRPPTRPCDIGSARSALIGSPAEDRVQAVPTRSQDTLVGHLPSCLSDLLTLAADIPKRLVLETNVQA